jgi:glycosyltransferase involved in cell wall biosynthesis
MAQDAPDAFPASGPQVGLFIPVRNGELYLEECITSIRRQTFTDWRLTIVDNCSTDSTRSIVERHASDSRITYFRNEKDLGSIGNFNRCLEMVDTEFYSMLSHDDFFRLPDALEQALRAMQAHPGIAVIYSDVEWVDETGTRITEKLMPFRGQVAGQALARRCLMEGRNHFGVPVLIRSGVVRGLRYDPAFPLTCDIDFSLACAARAPAYFLPCPAVAIRFHSSNGTMRAFKGTRAEFPALARKHAIPMGWLDSLRYRLYDILNTCKKRAFFFYLDHLRTRNPG